MSDLSKEHCTFISTPGERDLTCSMCEMNSLLLMCQYFTAVAAEGGVSFNHFIYGVVVM